MTFYAFMMKNYLNEDAPAGDLAQDMHRNKEEFPKNRSCKFDGWHTVILDYLQSRNACRECLETFDECWEEYVECEKKRLNKNSLQQ